MFIDCLSIEWLDYINPNNSFSNNIKYPLYSFIWVMFWWTYFVNDKGLYELEVI